MKPHREVPALQLGPNRFQGRIVHVGAVDVGADLHPADPLVSGHAVDLGDRCRDVLQGEGGEEMESVGPGVAEGGQGVVLNGGEIGADVGRNVIVEVGRGNGDHLDIHPLPVHVRQSNLRLEDAVGERAETLPARVEQIATSPVLDQGRAVVGMARSHLAQRCRDDGVGVDVDRGQGDVLSS